MICTRISASGEDANYSARFIGLTQRANRPAVPRIGIDTKCAGKFQPAKQKPAQQKPAKQATASSPARERGVSVGDQFKPAKQATEIQSHDG